MRVHVLKESLHHRRCNPNLPSRLASMTSAPRYGGRLLFKLPSEEGACVLIQYRRSRDHRSTRTDNSTGTSPTGGIRPPVRRRARQALSLFEREEISRWLSMRGSLRSIARHLGRSASTISREVHRKWRVGPLSSCPVRRTPTPTSGARRVLRQINEPAASNEESAPVILLPRTTASTCIEPAP